MSHRNGIQNPNCGGAWCTVENGETRKVPRSTELNHGNDIVCWHCFREMKKAEIPDIVQAREAWLQLDVVGHANPPTFEGVLTELCMDVEALGGIEYDEAGYAHIADYMLDDEDTHDWPDLAETYVKACLALGRKALVASGQEEEED